MERLLTSEQALLEESDKKKAAKKKKTKDGKTKSKKAPLEKVNASEAVVNEAVTKEVNPENPETCTTTFTVDRDVYYAVMFTKPAAYYIARSLNESAPPEGERYVMKFLDRGPNNTFFLPSRDKIEDVEREFILCKAELEGAGPFYLRNHEVIENLYKNKMRDIKKELV